MKLKLKSATTEQIAKSSLITAVSIIAGMTGFIRMGVSIYLTAAPLFLSPLILKFRGSILSTLISVLIIDWITGGITYTGISVLGYISGIVVVWLFSKKGKTTYMLGTALGCILLLSIYTLIGGFIDEHGTALMMFIGTSIQMSVVGLVVFILYKPIKLCESVNLF